MASKCLIHLPRLAAVIASERSALCVASVSMRNFQNPIAAQICLRSMQTVSGSKQAPQSESSVDLEQRILAKAMDHVPVYGWTVETLAAGAIDLGYPSVAHGMFSRGAVELVDYFMDLCFAKMRKTLIINTEKLQAIPVADRLKFGVRTRLEMLQPVLATWPQGMAAGALPQNVPGTVKRLAKLSDEIWYFGGDKSTDIPWYTKRAILTAIYASTELFMLNDKSPEFQETWKFLDRRVDETIQLGEVPQSLNDALGMASIGLQSAFSAVTSLASPMARQIISNSPLSAIPNPITAVGTFMPSSVVSVVAAGIPFNGSVFTRDDAMDFQSNDLHDINQELEKLGGVDESERPT